MTRKLTFLTALILLSLTSAMAQKSEKITLADQNSLIPINTGISSVTYQGKPAVRVVDQAKAPSTEIKYAKLKNVRFENGTIELEVAGKPLEGASETARGFVGIAFRIAEDDSRFECIYLRPTNGRADDQVRRNHSVQYISFPDWPWEKTRRETPGKYETYVDLASGEWTKIRIVVEGDKAKLYVHGASQPTLVVNDLKLGGTQSGGIGLWIGPGTDAYFTNMVVTTAQ